MSLSEDVKTWCWRKNSALGSKVSTGKEVVADIPEISWFEETFEGLGSQNCGPVILPKGAVKSHRVTDLTVTASDASSNVISL